MVQFNQQDCMSELESIPDVRMYAVTRRNLNGVLKDQ